eukprot:TRINITY_DN4512_c0_g4_i1.p1 TRINITY_DN4512_c0_g4~~TRINITY_DN4512_c0_g4_i1.p1  ORF type:complete len:815 (-),score=226.83 TRINITY_DN4512_c0_g4_i1:53-2497(-)
MPSLLPEGLDEFEYALSKQLDRQEKAYRERLREQKKAKLRGPIREEDLFITRKELAKIERRRKELKDYLEHRHKDARLKRAFVLAHTSVEEEMLKSILQGRSAPVVYDEILQKRMLSLAIFDNLEALSWYFNELEEDDDMMDSIYNPHVSDDEETDDFFASYLETPSEMDGIESQDDPDIIRFNEFWQHVHDNPLTTNELDQQVRELWPWNKDDIEQEIDLEFPDGNSPLIPSDLVGLKIHLRRTQEIEYNAVHLDTSFEDTITLAQFALPQDFKPLMEWYAENLPEKYWHIPTPIHYEAPLFFFQHVSNIPGWSEDLVRNMQYEEGWGWMGDEIMSTPELQEGLFEERDPADPMAHIMKYDADGNPQDNSWLDELEFNRRFRRGVRNLNWLAATHNDPSLRNPGIFNAKPASDDDDDDPYQSDGRNWVRWDPETKQYVKLKDEYFVDGNNPASDRLIANHVQLMDELDHKGRMKKYLLKPEAEEPYDPTEWLWKEIDAFGVWEDYYDYPEIQFADPDGPLGQFREPLMDDYRQAYMDEIMERWNSDEEIRLREENQEKAEHFWERTDDFEVINGVTYIYENEEDNDIDWSRVAPPRSLLTEALASKVVSDMANNTPDDPLFADYVDANEGFPPMANPDLEFKDPFWGLVSETNRAIDEDGALWNATDRLHEVYDPFRTAVLGVDHLDLERHWPFVEKLLGVAPTEDPETKNWGKFGMPEHIRKQIYRPTELQRLRKMAQEQHDQKLAGMSEQERMRQPPFENPYDVFFPFDGHVSPLDAESHPSMFDPQGQPLEWQNSKDYMPHAEPNLDSSQ